MRIRLYIWGIRTRRSIGERSPATERTFTFILFKVMAAIPWTRWLGPSTTQVSRSCRSPITTWSPRIPARYATPQHNVRSTSGRLLRSERPIPIHGRRRFRPRRRGPGPITAHRPGPRPSMARVNHASSLHKTYERTSSVRDRTRRQCVRGARARGTLALLHDLTHYAVEVEAGLTSSDLYGLASVTTSFPFTQAPCSRNCMPSIVAL